MLTVPHVVTSIPAELVGLLGALDAVMRYTSGCAHRDAWFESGRRCERLGIRDMPLEQYITEELRRQLQREPTEREQMIAICEFWREHMID